MRQLVGLAVVVVVLAWGQVAQAAPIFESALLGGTGVGGGSAVSLNQFLGVRFELTETVETQLVGGHFFAGSGTIFAALVALDGLTDFPDSSDLTTADVIGTSLLAPPLPSHDVFAPLSVVLNPGWYGLVFGSQLFGATSPVGGAPNSNPTVGTPSFFLHNSLGWRDLNIGHESEVFRFVLNGTPVPEPTTLLLLGTGLGVVAYRRRPARR